MTAAIRWADPPPDGRTLSPDAHRSPARDYGAIARDLRTQPGRWALVAECTTRSGYNIARRMRQGATAGFRPAGAFEAECRQVGVMTHVYARYLPGGAS